MPINLWENFFKPEVRSAGRVFVAKGKVSVSQLSDTEIQSHVKASSGFKVILKSESVESNTVNATCTCPNSKKGQFCKHIWAAILMTEDKKPDFLDGKNNLQIKTQSILTPTKTPQSEARAQAQAAYKNKQAEYRKLQYQIQKERLKKIKLSKSNPEAQTFPLEVEKALRYFSDNGFELRDTLNKANVSLAMKKLAKFFHPDVGGSHREIQELNQFSEILTKYAKN